jgi:DNA polymerase III epsilon subunit-like protein
MPKAPSSLINLNGNMLASVDVETTGRLAGYHEIIQIAVVPLTSAIEPVPDRNPFYVNIAPEHPERCEKDAQTVHGLNISELVNNCPSPWKVADLFDEWVQSFDLPFNKKLVPLAHNWGFERGFLMHWLGIESFDALWFSHARDTMGSGIMINDAASYHGLDVPFPYLGLKSMCQKFGIVNPNPHDALADALTGAKLYKALLASFGS